jgi:hypothetical protein
MVGKMTTLYLLRLPLPSTQQVDNIAYLLKKGRVERLMLTTLYLWKVEVEGTMFLYIESLKVPPSTS